LDSLMSHVQNTSDIAARCVWLCYVARRVPMADARVSQIGSRKG
jgi:hypothetical protein